MRENCSRPCHFESRAMQQRQMTRKLYINFALFLLCMQTQLLQATDFKKGLEHMESGDYAMAFCLWEPLARLGHPDAQYHLGWLYANGNGLNVDVRRAVYWWQQAANNGYLDAQFAIGLAYTTGEGLKADRTEAFKWFISAAKSGHEDSRDIVKRLVLESGENYYDLYPELKNIDWLRQSVVVKGDVVNLREGPGTSFKIVHKAKKGDVLTKIAQKDNWLEVIIDEANNQSAWIYSKLVNTL